MTKEAPTPARMAMEGPPLPPFLSSSPLLPSTSLVGSKGVADGEMNEVTKTVVLPATEVEEDRDADGVGFALSSVAVW